MSTSPLKKEHEGGKAVLLLLEALENSAVVTFLAGCDAQTAGHARKLRAAMQRFRVIQEAGEDGIRDVTVRKVLDSREENLSH